jgi:hypothetical protein
VTSSVAAMANGSPTRWNTTTGREIEPESGCDPAELAREIRSLIGCALNIRSEPARRVADLRSRRACAHPRWVQHRYSSVVARLSSTDLYSYDVSKDGRRFIINKYQKPEAFVRAPTGHCAKRDKVVAFRSVVL